MEKNAKKKTKYARKASGMEIVRGERGVVS